MHERGARSGHAAGPAATRPAFARRPAMRLTIPGWVDGRPATALTLMLAAAMLILAAAAAAPAQLSAAAHAAVWTAPAGERIFPSTPAAARQTAAVSAAGGEYEGVLVGLRGGGDPHPVRATWAAGSDALLTQNAELFEVAYVHVRRPTTDSGARAGLYPDPILPRRFGQAISVPGHSSSLYVLFHVPFGTPAGTYRGTLQLANGGEAVDLPVSLHVWAFGWRRLSTHTAFLVNLRNVMTSAQRAGVPWTRKNVGTIFTSFYRMMQQHGLTPMMPNVLPRVSSNGSFDEGRYLEDVAPFLAAAGLDLPDAQIPWSNWFPHTPWRQVTGSSTLLRYLTQVSAFYKRHGWQDKAYAFMVDEPNGTSEERAAERYARVLHKASAQAGFRLRFLLTDDPRPTAVTTHPANSFLFDDVDIWATRYFYFFGRVPALRKLQRGGKEIWWYPYGNKAVRSLPGFVIEKPLADQRVWGWLMHQWDVDGMLYWGVNRWGDAVTGKGLRDPYADPLSYRKRDGRVVNGEAMLVYPGYYPRYELRDAYAAPVSSLRLEALRDGMEDKEYLRLAAASGGGGAAFARDVSESVTWYPYPVTYGHVLKFPKYVTAMSAFNAARTRLAERIEQSL
jgi:hypothetical protein